MKRQGKNCKEVKLVLEGERPPSWNSLWSQGHWTKRKKLKDECALALRAAVDPDVAFIFKCRVMIHVRVYYKGRLSDWDNTCIKPYQDALIGLYLEDDNPDYVVGGSIRVFKDNKNPRLEIDIVPVIPIEDTP